MLLADVHGNLEALEAVLADIERSAPDALLVCAGDVVGYGADPETCIERLRDRQALIVLGNHEEMVLGRRDFSQCVRAGIIAAVWTRRRLSLAARHAIEGWPPSLELAGRVVVCHGDLEDAGRYVSTPARAEEAIALLRARKPEAGVLICGHTHHPMLYAHASGLTSMAEPASCQLPSEPCIINPGAVGQARGGLPLARYAVLDLERRMITYRALGYDHQLALRKLRRAGLVARVVMPPPHGIGRQIDRLRTRWARFRLGSQPP